MKYDEFDITDNMNENEKLTVEEQKRIHALVMEKINDKTETVNISDFNTQEPSPVPQKRSFWKYALAAAAAFVLCGGAVIAGVQLMKNNSIVDPTSTVSDETAQAEDYSSWIKSENGDIPSDLNGFSMFTELQSYPVGTEKISYYVRYNADNLPENLTEEELLEQYGGTTGEYFTLEKLVDGEWLMPPGDVVFNALGYMLNANGTPVQFSAYLNAYEATITAGHYRIIKELYGAERTLLAAEFDIVSSDYDKDAHIKQAQDVFGGEQIKVEHYVEIHDYNASDTAPIFNLVNGTDEPSYLIAKVIENGITTVVYDVTKTGRQYHIITCRANDSEEGFKTDYNVTSEVFINNSDGIIESSKGLLFNNSDELVPMFKFIVPENEANKVLWSTQSVENTLEVITQSVYEYNDALCGDFNLRLTSKQGDNVFETGLSSGATGLNGIELPLDNLDEYFTLYELESGNVLAFHYPLKERYYQTAEQKIKTYLTTFYGITESGIYRVAISSQSGAEMRNEGETLLPRDLKAYDDTLTAQIYWDLQNSVPDDSIGLPETTVNFEFNFENIANQSDIGSVTASCHTARTDNGVETDGTDSYSIITGTSDYSSDGIVSYNPNEKINITTHLPDGWFGFGNKYYNASGIKQEITVEAVTNESFEHFVERITSEDYYSRDRYAVKRNDTTSSQHNGFAVAKTSFFVGDYEESTEKYVYLYYISNYSNVSVTIRAEQSAELSDTTLDSIAESLQYYSAVKKEKLTLDAVKELAKKGEELSWSNFAMYEGIDIGSGLYIVTYAIDDEYLLMIGGVPNEKPMYMRLVRNENTDVNIDIRYEDVDAFLNYEIKQSKLTLDDVRALAQKGEELSWSDFDGFFYTLYTDGITDRRYPIDESLMLRIYGSSTEEKPDGICLINADDSDISADIRTEDFEAFIKENQGTSIY